MKFMEHHWRNQTPSFNLGPSFNGVHKKLILNLGFCFWIMRSMSRVYDLN